MSVTRQMLNDLAKGAMLTGQLSEIHIKNMKLYPFVFFDHVKSVSINHNIVIDPAATVPGLGSVIRYTLTFEDNYAPDLLLDRLKALIGATHTLLWSSISVEVFDNAGEDLKKLANYE